MNARFESILLKLSRRKLRTVIISFIVIIVGVLLIISSTGNEPTEFVHASPGGAEPTEVVNPSWQGVTDPPHIENNPPVLLPVTDKTIVENHRFEITIRAVDPDGDTLHYWAQNLPPGAVFGGYSPQFSWEQPVAGTYDDIVVTVSDGRMSDSLSFSIEVKPWPDRLQPPVEGVLPMHLIYYGPHTKDIDDRILSVKPEYIIGNTPHGLWGDVSNYEIFPTMDRYREAGIKIIGYLTAGYERQTSGGAVPAEWYSLENNLRLIKNMAELDHVDGIFIDECSSFPDEESKAYLAALTKKAHSYGLMTWGNVGVPNFDPWYFTDGGFDLMNANENWMKQELTPVQMEWGYRISVAGLHSDITAEEAYRMTADAVLKGLIYCYITPSYGVLPEWFEAYVALQKE